MQIGETTIETVRGDIVTMEFDAIVNAANSSLLGGGGVDGAIHRAAGPELLAECRTLGGCETGDAKVTRGYDLPARHVVHTVGPVWRGGDNGEAERLASCYARSLDRGAEVEARSIGFPAISTGIYGYPVEKAAKTSVETIAEWVADNPQTYDRIALVCFDQATERAFGQALETI
ncbi:MAG: O-acetyl-ADP-ribose deacetylase [Erythrobacter sp.]